MMLLPLVDHQRCTSDTPSPFFLCIVTSAIQCERLDIDGALYHIKCVEQLFLSETLPDQLESDGCTVKCLSMGFVWGKRQWDCAGIRPAAHSHSCRVS